MAVPSGGFPIVLTAPLTESVDHAGFFIQMSLASIPEWMEWVFNKKYPHGETFRRRRKGRRQRRQPVCACSRQFS
jgi:hypothetical protein